MSHLKTIVYASDWHVPHHDPKLFKGFLRFLRDIKPDEVILGGDVLDLESVSSHGGNPTPPKLVAEVGAGKAFLDQVVAAAPRALISYIEGNHEDRLARYIADKAPTLEKSLSIPSLLKLDERGIQYYRYGEVLFRGRLGFTHGFYVGESHAAQHLRKFGCCLVYGHTHRPQTYTAGIAGDKVRGTFGMGCMCGTKKVPYIKGRPSGWQQGFGVFYVDQDGSFYPYTVMANDSAFVWNGKVYGG
jgi:predicted phosphodiesterase